jgi:hypothetical protein
MQMRLEEEGTPKTVVNAEVGYVTDRWKTPNPLSPDISPQKRIRRGVIPPCHLGIDAVAVTSSVHREGPTCLRKFQEPLAVKHVLAQLRRAPVCGPAQHTYMRDCRQAH